MCEIRMLDSGSETAGMTLRDMPQIRVRPRYPDVPGIFEHKAMQHRKKLSNHSSDKFIQDGIKM
ncbi:MAG: hypothetical protein AB9866_15590 [Syntrophobacteraceae bacterium]